MYVIIGANGYLGSYFIKNILQKTDEKILAVARNVNAVDSKRISWATCDILKKDDVEILSERYLTTEVDNKIIFLAAYHNPDLVEKNPKLAWNTNVTALSYFVNCVDNVKSFFYPSTDSVYGENLNMKPFTEEAVANPVNIYGKQKSVAEKIVTGYGYNVVRYPFLIGPSLTDKKEHFYDVIVRTLLDNKRIEMLSDSYRSTLTFDLVTKLTLEIIEKHYDDAPKVLNVCGDEALSKYQVGLKIADKLGVSRNLVEPISINNQSGFFKAKRASSSIMDNSRLKKLLNLEEVKFSL